VTVWPAVLVSAWFGGVGAGLAATALSAVAGHLLFQRPDPLATPELAETVLFVAVGSALSLACGRLRRAEAALREGEAHYRTLFEANPHPMWVFDAETLRFLAVNDAAVKRYGYSRDEFLAMTLKDIHPPEGVPRLLAVLARWRRPAYGAEVWRHLRRDGTVREVEVSAHALDYHGRPAWLVLAVDVTERRRVEAERDRLLARLQLQVERMPLAYVLIDAELRVVGWNPAAERTFGYASGEVLGRSAVDLLVPSAARAQVEEVVRRLRAGDMAAHSVNENVTRDGRVITCEWFNTPLAEPDGRFAGVLCLAQDLTDRMILERSCGRPRRWRRSAGWPAGWPTTSTTC
jgi:PAS domain S-box-containing protein